MKKCTYRGKVAVFFQGILKHFQIWELIQLMSLNIESAEKHLWSSLVFVSLNKTTLFTFCLVASFTCHSFVNRYTTRSIASPICRCRRILRSSVSAESAGIKLESPFATKPSASITLPASVSPMPSYRPTTSLLFECTKNLNLAFTASLWVFEYSPKIDSVID